MAQSFNRRAFVSVRRSPTNGHASKNTGWKSFLNTFYPLVGGHYCSTSIFLIHFFRATYNSLGRSVDGRSVTLAFRMRLFPTARVRAAVYKLYCISLLFLFFFSEYFFRGNTTEKPLCWLVGRLVTLLLLVWQCKQKVPLVIHRGKKSYLFFNNKHFLHKYHLLITFW